jgi:hypothetical protein
MKNSLTARKFALIAGASYWVIFFAAIFANFVVLESLLNNSLTVIQENHIFVRAGIFAFLINAVFDVVVAWAHYELYKGDSLSLLSVLFRMMHAVIMSIAIFSLAADSVEEILRQVAIFNTIWLIGLFFFGIHLILLGNIIGKPKTIAFFLIFAGIMYAIDTAAHFVLPNHEVYDSVFLALVAISRVCLSLLYKIQSTIHRQPH